MHKLYNVATHIHTYINAYKNIRVFNMPTHLFQQSNRVKITYLHELFIVLIALEDMM